MTINLRLISYNLTSIQNYNILNIEWFYSAENLNFYYKIYNSILIYVNNNNNIYYISILVLFNT